MGGLLCLIVCSTAQAKEPIATDRPDFVESSDIVGRGRFQIKTSIAFERDKGTGYSSRVHSTPTLLRWGVSEDWELRLESDSAIRQQITEAGISSRQRGTADVTQGGKWHWRDGDEDSGTPGLAWLVHVNLDSGSTAFRGQGPCPSLRMVAERELPGGWSAGAMPGIYQDRNENELRFTGAILAGVLGKSLTDSLRGFV